MRPRLQRDLVNELVGGRGIHPVTSVAGGISFALDSERHDTLRRWVDEALTLVTYPLVTHHGTDQARKGELQAARDRLASLEKTIEGELAALPAQFGFDSAQAFADAVVKASAGGARPARKGGRPKGAGKPKGKRKRSVVTDELRNQVKQLAEAGQTGNQIKAAKGIPESTNESDTAPFGITPVFEQAFACFCK